MRSFISLLATVLFTANVAFGQSETTMQSPVPGSSTVAQAGMVSENPERHKITRLKINPLISLSGDMPVYLERELKANLSAEISVGTTFDNMLSDVVENTGQPDLSVSKEGLNSFSFSAALRHYPTEKGINLEGYYFAPEVRFRDYRSEVTNIGGNELHLKQARQVLDGKFVIGYINQTNDRIFFDLYGGIGMRYKFYQDRIENYSVIYDPATGQTNMQLKLDDQLRRSMLLSLGFKVGFNF